MQNLEVVEAHGAAERRREIHRMRYLSRRQYFFVHMVRLLLEGMAGPSNCDWR
jgi:hypothetical protein